MIFHSYSENDTVRFASGLAKELQGGERLLLEGPLGAGKSVFARALIRALCRDPGLEVPSPTFTLLQTYEGAKGPVHHFDLYRIREPDEIFELGWEEALSGGVVLVEWPERLGPYAPAGATRIAFSAGENGGESRIIEVRR